MERAQWHPDCAACEQRREAFQLYLRFIQMSDDLKTGGDILHAPFERMNTLVDLFKAGEPNVAPDRVAVGSAIGEVFLALDVLRGLVGTEVVDASIFAGVDRMRALVEAHEVKREAHALADRVGQPCAHANCGQLLVGHWGSSRACFCGDDSQRYLAPTQPLAADDNATEAPAPTDPSSPEGG